MGNDEKTDIGVKMTVGEGMNLDEKRDVEKSARVVGRVRTAMQLIPSGVPYT